MDGDNDAVAVKDGGAQLTRAGQPIGQGPASDIGIFVGFPIFEELVNKKRGEEVAKGSLSLQHGSEATRSRKSETPKRQ
jgi:hypothetical protein